MGTALLRGILASEWGKKPNLLASHPKKPKAAALNRELGIRVIGQNLEVARHADILILGVKPQILGPVLTEIRPALCEGQLRGSSKTWSRRRAEPPSPRSTASNATGFGQFCWTPSKSPRPARRSSGSRAPGRLRLPEALTTVVN
jgi:hypothetical protein